MDRPEGDHSLAEGSENNPNTDDRRSESRRADASTDDRSTTDLAAVTGSLPVVTPSPLIRPVVAPDLMAEAAPDLMAKAGPDLDRSTSEQATDRDRPTELTPDLAAATTVADGPAALNLPAVRVPGFRRAGALWGALAVLFALLVTAAMVGRFVVPDRRASLAAVPTTAAPTTTVGRSTAPSSGPSPTLAAPSAPARPADALAPWAGRISEAIGVPVVAVQAYAYAQLLIESTNPQCHLGWTTLAGIGEVDSRHGQAGGAVLDKTGRSVPPLLGPPLDGRDGRPLVSDTDAGAYDGDATYDRAMGPMMLLPTVWRANASDADNDHIQDPYDIDDASLAVARLLCSGGEDLATLAGWTAAIGRFQAGPQFAQDVFKAADSYGQRTRNVG